MKQHKHLAVAVLAIGSMAFANAFAQQGRPATQPQDRPGTQPNDPNQRSGYPNRTLDDQRNGTATRSDTSTMPESKANAPADSSFVTKAATGGIAEVELGKLAKEKASSDEVKQFAERMVEDHSKANEELKQVASSKGVNLPSDVDAKHKAEMEKLSKLSGPDFDRAYMQSMVKDHKKDVAEFRKEANKGKDPEVKAFASKTLPTLEEHLKLAQDTAAKVTSSASSGARSSSSSSADRSSTSSDSDKSSSHDESDAHQSSDKSK